MIETNAIPPTLPPPRRRVPKPLRGPLTRVLSLDELERGYAKIAGETDNARSIERALSFLEVRTELEPGAETTIPRSGATLVVANHTLDGREALAITRILLARRPDVRLIADSILAAIPELAPLVFAIDRSGSEAAARANFASLRGAARWIEMGGCLLAFPAGTSVARLARRGAAAVHPLWIDKRGTIVRLTLGTCIRAAELSGFDDEEAAGEYLRLRTEVLGLCQRTLRAQRVGAVNQRAHTPLAPRVSQSQLASEVAALCANGCVLAEQGQLSVLGFTGQSSRALLHELARERERAFRSAGQGSGLARDLDRFDEHYQHIVLWDQARQRVAGAVRLVAADQVTRERGVRGLYTSTLFEYGPELVRRIGPCFELGRSFVAEEYQRSYAALLSLWKGIAAHVAREPERTKLIGSVSIGAHYSPLARQIIAHFLERHHRDAELGSEVRARTPLRRARIAGWDPLELERALGSTIELSKLLADLEPDRKGLPVLLRACLELGARVLEIGLDAHFENTLDALVLIDLEASPRRILERCFGRASAEKLFANGERLIASLRASA